MGDAGILILGVGNTLMRDDGIGVWVLRSLAERYRIPSGLRLVDGGVAGLGLLPEISCARRLIVVDAVKGGGPPGTVYRLTPADLPVKPRLFLSAHEVGIRELLSTAEFLGKLPSTRIIGVEPKEAATPGLELTEPLRRSLPDAVRAVVEELSAMGIRLREAPKGHKRHGGEEKAHA